MDPKTIELFARRRREAPERTLAFFRALDPRSVAPALATARAIAERTDVRDAIYRIFHQSFKMYRLRDASVALAEGMLVPVGGRLADETLCSALRRHGLDDGLVDLVERTDHTRFSKERNEPSAWAEDARQLTSGFLVVREVALASLEAMDRMTRREGFLFDEAPLDPTDALFLETWVPVGIALRSVRPEGLEHECRRALAEKADR